MKNNTIVIRCITDPLKGFGNFNRCFTLATELEKLGCNFFFVIDNKAVIKLLNNKKWSYQIIPKFHSRLTESKFLIKLMKKKKFNTILIDMREYGEEISFHIYKSNLKVIMLDDAWTKNVFADIIINGTNVKKYHDYRIINKSSKLCVGPKYWISKKEFTKNKKKLSEIYTKKIYNVTISLGGSDPDNLTEFFVKALENFPRIKLTVIIGPFFKRRKNLLKLRNKNIKILEEPKNLWNTFHSSDIVISSCGNTLFELAIQKIPTLCIPIVDHQIPYATAFKKSGFCMILGYPNSLKKNRIQNSINKIINDTSKRKKMSQIGGKLIDGQGLTRVTNIIRKFMVDYKQ